MSGEKPLSRLSEVELLDSLYKTLANQHRRKILQYLADRPESISTADLATEIAIIEYGVESSAITSKQLSNTHISLVHVHLPVLSKAGLVSWDRDGDSVVLSPSLDELVVTTTGNVLDVSVSVNKAK